MKSWMKTPSRRFSSCPVKRMRLPSGVHRARPEKTRVVGVQWELRGALARTGERLGQHERLGARTRRPTFFPEWPSFRLLFEPGPAVGARLRDSRRETVNRSS